MAEPVDVALSPTNDQQVRAASAAIVIALCVLMARTSVTLASDAMPTWLMHVSYTWNRRRVEHVIVDPARIP